MYQSKNQTKTFQPNVMFVSKASAYPRKEQKHFLIPSLNINTYVKFLKLVFKSRLTIQKMSLFFYLKNFLLHFFNIIFVSLLRGHNSNMCNDHNSENQCFDTDCGDLYASILWCESPNVFRTNVFRTKVVEPILPS
jgi:hypothetical protein